MNPAELTEVEQLLWEAFPRGAWVDLGGSGTGTAPVIRAEVIAALLLGGVKVEPGTAAGIRLRVPRPGLCTDNGAMVAALGAELVARGVAPSPLDIPADSSLPVTDVVVR